MGFIIETLFKKPKVFSGIHDINKPSPLRLYLNASNIFITLLLILFLRIFDIPQPFILLLASIFFYFISQYYIQEFHHKLDFLNKIMFDDNEQHFDTQSFLEIDPDIVNFYYKIRYYIDDNLSAYRKSLERTNDVLRYHHNLKANLMDQPEQLYENALFNKRDALNNLHSAIYKSISQQVNNDVFNNNLTELDKLLTKHMKDLMKIIKCNYNKYDITIWSKPNPSNLNCRNDTKDVYYSPNYSFF